MAGTEATGLPLLGARRTSRISRAELYAKISEGIELSPTFLLLGIRPRTWWDAGRARRASKLALIAWLVLLAALFALILWTRPT